MKANRIKWLRKELLFLKWFRIFWPRFLKTISTLSVQLDFYLSLIGFFAVIYYSGFRHTADALENYSLFFRSVIWIFLINGILQLVIFYPTYLGRKLLYLKIFSILSIGLLIILNFEFTQENFIQNISERLNLIINVELFNLLFVLIVFFRQISLRIVKIQHYFVNPAQLFTASFIFIILFGSMLLMLPQSTYNGIHLVDALFTSTSAVCVTGLTSVDTYSCFTNLGKVFILILIQVGGIGVITFTGFFALFFRGNYSFKDQMMLKDIMNKNQLTGILRFIYYIIFSTFLFEGIGAVIIYFSTDSSLFQNNNQQWFFAIFHAVSAFCNAGFSNVDQGLANINFRYNYSVQMVIAFLIIFGGLGYNVYLSAQQRLIQRIKNLFWKRNVTSSNKQMVLFMNVNAKLALYTTIILLIGGTLLFLWTEYDSLLINFSWSEKIMVSFFSVVTPRTAGFNTYDMNLLANSSCLLLIFLMWVGASPGSTGGGIKTTTFAVAILNSISLGKGKDHLEVFNREIDVLSIRRAFSVITMSVLVIVTGTLLVHMFDPYLDFRAVVFECFSALGTVGLSLGITTSLSTGSKIVIILLMFVGRIGAITLLTGFIKKQRMQNYRYCSEQVYIN
jgi:trk system potassium uptake protein TrkH